MFDEILKAKVNREVGRLNGKLQDLKEHEESLRIRKARLEVEMRQALAMRDMFELLGRLDRQPEPACAVRLDPVLPDHPNGPQFVSFGNGPGAEAKRAATIAVAVQPDDDEKVGHKLKPANLPSVRDMIATVLEDASPKWLQPKQIANVVRQTWWPEVPPQRVASVAWGMARIGQLEKRGRRYRAKSNGQHPKRSPSATGPQSEKQAQQIEPGNTSRVY